MVRISNIELIRLLKKNSRMPYTEIAKKFGVTEAAIRKRIKQMVSSGTIRFTLDFSHEKFGMSRAIIGVDVKPEEYEKVIEEIRKMKEIDSAYSSTGDHMILVDICLSSMDEIFEFIKRLKEINGVIRVCPAILLKKII